MSATANTTEPANPGGVVLGVSMEDENKDNSVEIVHEDVNKPGSQTGGNKNSAEKEKTMSTMNVKNDDRSEKACVDLSPILHNSDDEDEVFFNEKDAMDNGDAEKEKHEKARTALKRRSSVARSIRRSQSNGTQSGFTFEQQLVASTLGNDKITAEEKLAKMVGLSLSATIRTLQQENEQLEVGTNLNLDDPKADLIDHLVSTLAHKPLINETELQNIINKINAFKKSSSSKKESNVGSACQNARMLSSRLRTLKQYQDSLNNEINAWDELLQQRKNKYNFVRLEKQMISRGEKKITNSHRSQLPRLEEAWLRGLSDGRAEMSRLKKQEVMMRLCKENLSERLARKRKILEEKNVQLEQIAKLICETVVQRLDSDADNLSGIPVTSSTSAAESIVEQKCKSETSEFAKEVQAWVQEMQSM